MADTDPTLNSEDATKVYFAHYPSGSSLKDVEHYAQIAKTNIFQRYDYGFFKNMEKYGQSYPPEIEIRNIKDVPIAIIAGN